MNDLSPESRAVLEAARHLDDPRPSDRARVRRALFARVMAGGAATLLTTSAAAAPIVKVLIVSAVVATAGVGGTVWWRAQQAPAAKNVQVQPVSATLATPVAPMVPALPAPPVVEAQPAAEPALSPPPAPAATPRPAAARARTVAAPRNLGIETSMLAEANEALRDGDMRLSLRLLDEYDRRFPAGALRQEMVGTRIIARCQLIPSPRNREAARLFLARYPASPLASRVRSSCASLAR